MIQTDPKTKAVFSNQFDFAGLYRSTSGVDEEKYRITIETNEKSKIEKLNSLRFKILGQDDSSNVKVRFNQAAGRPADYARKMWVVKTRNLGKLKGLILYLEDQRLNPDFKWIIDEICVQKNCDSSNQWKRKNKVIRYNESIRREDMTSARLV